MESNALKCNLSQGLNHVRSAQISRPTIVAVCSDKILIYGFQEEYFGHLEKGKACDTHLLLTPEVRKAYKPWIIKHVRRSNIPKGQLVNNNNLNTLYM